MAAIILVRTTVDSRQLDIAINRAGLLRVVQQSLAGRMVDEHLDLDRESALQANLHNATRHQLCQVEAMFSSQLQMAAPAAWAIVARQPVAYILQQCGRSPPVMRLACCLLFAVCLCSVNCLSVAWYVSST